jgi:hypothetical protein
VMVADGSVGVGQEWPRGFTFQEQDS